MIALSMLSIPVVIIQEIMMQLPLLDWTPEVDSVTDFWWPRVSIFLHILEYSWERLSIYQLIRNSLGMLEMTFIPPCLLRQTFRALSLPAKAWISENKAGMRFLCRVAVGCRCWSTEVTGSTWGVLKLRILASPVSVQPARLTCRHAISSKGFA